MGRKMTRYREILEKPQFFYMPLGALFALILSNAVAYAQVSKCDCKEIVGSCTASIKLDQKKSLATVRSSATQCARVIFYVDGTPGSTLFNGGKTIENITIFHKERKVKVAIQSCQVCAYRGDSPAKRDNSGDHAGGAQMDGNWRDMAGYVFTLQRGTVSRAGKVFGSYRGRTGHTQANTGSWSASCDLTLASANSIVLNCSTSQGPVSETWLRVN